jgi:signal transduction histidine kinase
MRRLPVPALDLALAVVCLAGAAAEFAFADYVWAPGQRAPQVVGAALACAVIALRRRSPAACVYGFVAALLAMSAIAEPPQLLSVSLAVLIVAFAVGAGFEGRQLMIGTLALIAATVIHDLDDPQHAGDPLIDPLFLLLAVAAGVVVHRRQRQVDHVAHVAAERAEDALRLERSRIARELHDVIAHGVSVMVVQADSARDGVAAEDTETRAALAAIERTGRESLRELRRLLGLLRDEDEAASLAPQPGITDLPALVQSVRRAGLPVELRIEGDAVGLAPGADLAAYRIVQEALTNALRHAGPARATVRVAYDPRRVLLEVADTGRGDGAYGNGAGQGLIAMRERARLYGGSFDARRRSDGFVVTAELPLDPAE